MKELRLRVTIPYGVEFGNLHLARDPDDGLVCFEMAPIQAICEASALDPEEWDGSMVPGRGGCLSRRNLHQAAAVTTVILGRCLERGESPWLE